MEKNKLADNSYESNSKEVLHTYFTSRPTPTPRRFEPETTLNSNPAIPAPCSSPAVLKHYLTTILETYGVATSIFKHLTPGDVLRWVLASKDIRHILSRDRGLIRLLVGKHCIIRRAPEFLDSGCPWGVGYECAGCLTWPCGTTPELPLLTNPGERLYTFCSTCTKKLPKFVFDGRCLCNTQWQRSLCSYCKREERARLSNAGLQWFSPKRPKRLRNGHRKVEEVERKCRGMRCNGVDDDGYACRNFVDLFGVGKSDEGVKGERVVNCCTWCGLVAVDVPTKRLKGR